MFLIFTVGVLSWLIYGVQVKNKKEWSRIFNLGIDKVTKKQKRRPRFTIKQLKKIFDSQLEPVYKTKAEQCPVCKGRGTIQKIKVLSKHIKIMNHKVQCC